jgi:hypothetical protein
MPRVPTYNNLQTSISGQPGVQFQSPGGPTPGGIAADQANQLGQATLRAGDAIGRVALDMDQQVNETRVMDAVNKAKERAFDLTYNKETGYAMQKGIHALERPDGADLAHEYTQKFQKDIDEIGGSLGNDAQRLAFAKHAGQLRTDMYGSAERHMSQEFVRYQDSVYDGATLNAQRQIAVNYTDVAKGGAVEQGVSAIEAATRAKARLAGLSQEFADTQVRKAVSNAHVLAIATALEKNDVAFAEGYVKKFAKQMDADDILKMQGHVTKEMDLRRGDEVATQSVARMAPRLFNNDGDRVVSITIGSESNGQRYGPDGKTLLTSPKGAKGEMQVLDTTNKDPGFGVKPAQNDTPDERARVGRDYIKAMVQRYEGDLGKAWAAYNAGPGALDQAVARANGRAGGDWLTFMPAETQAYVKKNLAAYSAGEGRAATPTIADVHAQVRQQLGPDARPQVLQAALQKSTQQFEDLTKAKTAQDAETVANAMRALVQNGGKYSDLPASVRAALPPKDIDNVMNFGARIAKGDDTTNSALYLKLSSDQGYLTGLTDNQFYQLRGQLNEADFKHFSNERAAKLAGGGGNGFGELNTQAIKDTLDDRLRSLKIDPTPKDGSDDAVHVGTVHRFVRNEIAEAQRLAGKKFTDVETARFVDKLFATNVQFKNTILGFSTGTSSQALLSMKPGDIPADVKNALKKDFARRGNASPTDADLLGAYLQFAKRRPQSGGATGSY